MNAKETARAAEAPEPPASGVRRTPSQIRRRSEASAARQRQRSRRKRAVRGRSICVKRLSRVELEVGRRLFPEGDPAERPTTRGDCAGAARPCPYVSCSHHLYLDVFSRTGAIKLNFPDLEVWELSESCSLDVADRGGTTLEEAGTMMNLTRERIRQVEALALTKLETLELAERAEDAPPPKRHLPLLGAPTKKVR